MLFTGLKGRDFKDPRDFPYKEIRTGVINPYSDVVMMPVQDQGTVGACVWKVTTAVMEVAQLLCGDQEPFYLSALDGYYAYRAAYGNVLLDDGSFPRLAMEIARTRGICREGIWPYDGSKWDKKPPVADKYFKVEEYRRLDDEDKYETLSNIMDALSRGWAVTVAASLFTSFLSDEVARTGIVPMPNYNTERREGGHDMVIKGHDLARERFKLRNSWGSGWGLEGDCWVPFQFVTDLCQDFYVVTRVN